MPQMNRVTYIRYHKNGAFCRDASVKIENILFYFSELKKKK